VTRPFCLLGDPTQPPDLHRKRLNTATVARLKLVTPATGPAAASVSTRRDCSRVSISVFAR